MEGGRNVERSGVGGGRYIGIESGRMSVICRKNGGMGNEKCEIGGFKLGLK